VTLSTIGAFSNLATLTPQPGIVPYDINVPFWSDNAIKTRWFSVPNTNLTIGWSPTNNWSFPTGTVWIKHFDLVTNYVTQARTRLETRFLVRNAGGIYGVTYRWGVNPNNATLVGPGGATDRFVITGPGGTVRTQNWYYPSRADCVTCHSSVAGLGLGFHTAQLNRTQTYTNFPRATGATDNQLTALAAAGYFSSAMSDPATLPALANWDDSSATLEWRVRSYVDANCVQCHQPGGLGQGFWDARYYLTTSEAKLVWGALKNNLGNTNAHVITPHSTTDSMLFQRMSGLVGTRMPPLATSVLDTNNMNLVAQWIAALPDKPSLTITPAASSGAFTIVWPADPGLFDLYTTIDLMAPISWTRTTNSPAVANGNWTTTIPTASGTSRFYRLQLR
jgi:hypothetical protein